MDAVRREPPGCGGRAQVVLSDKILCDTKYMRRVWSCQGVGPRLPEGGNLLAPGDPCATIAMRAFPLPKPDDGEAKQR